MKPATKVELAAWVAFIMGVLSAASLFIDTTTEMRALHFLMAAVYCGVGWGVRKKSRQWAIAGVVMSALTMLGVIVSGFVPILALLTGAQLTASILGFQGLTALNAAVGRVVVGPQASQSNTPNRTASARESAAQDADYYVKGDPESVAEVIAGSIGSTFSFTKFGDWIKGRNLAEGWTLGDALAVWYSLGHLALVVAAWQAYKERTQVFGILDHCRPRVLKHWNVPGDIVEKLRTVVNETEAAAVASFTSCKDGNDLSRFFSRYVSWILGTPVPFSERSIFEDQLMGIKYQGLDPILHATVCTLFVGVCTATKELLEQCRKGGMDWHSPMRNGNRAIDAKGNRDETAQLTPAPEPGYRFKEGDKVQVQANSDVGRAVVARDVAEMQEFYRGVVLNSQGRATEGRQTLQELLAEKRLATVNNGTNAIVVQYAVECGPEELRRVTRWGHLVQVRFEDGEAPGLEAWMDDSELKGRDGESPLDRNSPVPNGPQAIDPRGAVLGMTRVQPLRPIERVEFAADGRTVLKGDPSVGCVGFIRQLAQVFRRDLQQEERRIFEHWLGISDGCWTQAHEDAFVRGFERFLYAGRVKDESLLPIQGALRQEYPVLRGSAIDIALPAEVRRAYSRLLGGTVE